MSENSLPVEAASRSSAGLGDDKKSNRAEELKVLVDGLERILKVQFPIHDNWNSGLTRWEKDRRNAIDTLISEIKKSAYC